MKLFFLFIFSVIASFAATAQVALGPITANTLVLQDAETYRLSLFTGTPLTVAAPIASGDTTITLSGCPTLGANGVSVLIEQEPILVTVCTTGSATVTRNSALTQANTVATSHIVGATVQVLKFLSFQAMMREAIRQFLTGTVIPSLGPNSALVGTNLAAIATNQAAFQAALAGASQ